MKDKGILLSIDTGDIDIRVIRNASGKITGGLVIDNVTRQNQETIIVMHMGEFKGAPTVGVGISSMLLSHEALFFKHKIREQLEADGQRVSYLNIKTDTSNHTEILINGNYPK